MGLSFEMIGLCLIILMAQGAFQSLARQLINQDLIVVKHEQWMARHGRTYPDSSEKERRFQIFKNNLEYIEKFNSGANETYKLGLNVFADLTNEEFVATYTSQNMPPLPTTYTTTDDYNQDEVPERIDWREKGAVTSIKNQGKCGCCWAFSAAAAVEGVVANGVSLSAQQLLDCVSKNQGCSGGWMNNAFEYIIQNQGIASETDYSYQEAQQMCRSSSSAAAAQITGFQNVEENEEALKRAVARQPVSVTIYSSSPNFQHYRGGVFAAQGCGTKPTHAVTLVGYGTRDEDGTKYWIVKNSWGETWGESGYMKLQRDVGSVGGPCGITLHASYPTLK